MVFGCIGVLQSLHELLKLGLLSGRAPQHKNHAFSWKAVRNFSLVETCLREWMSIALKPDQFGTVNHANNLRLRPGLDRKQQGCQKNDDERRLRLISAELVHLTTSRRFYSTEASSMPCTQTSCFAIQESSGNMWLRQVDSTNPQVVPHPGKGAPDPT